MWRISGLFALLSVVVLGWLISELGLVSFTRANAGEQAPATVESLRSDLESQGAKLAERQRDLDRREKALADKEQAMVVQMAEYEKVVGDLRAKLAEAEKKQKTVESSFVQIYERMEPKRAARILDELEIDLAVNILRSIRAPVAAEILGNMSSQRAKLITEKQLTGRVLSSTQ